MPTDVHKLVVFVIVHNKLVAPDLVVDIVIALVAEDAVVTVTPLFVPGMLHAPVSPVPALFAARE